MNINLEHKHSFSSHNRHGEKRTWYVLILTLSVMAIEIIAGTLYGSMALLADGWHMGTHAAAFCIALFTYYYAQKHENSDDFSFGTGKVSVLGGYSSAIGLGIVALLMIGESIHRLFNPQVIQFNEAIGVAILGLVVNLASMILLSDYHHHSHEHEHHHDHNLRAAYMHVLADALTSVLAIVALIFAKLYAWYWLDAVMGIVGALVIGKWTLGLMKQSAPILLDQSIEQAYREGIREALEPYAQILDLHVWKISAEHHAAAITLVSDCDKTVNEYKKIIAQFDRIHHLTLEVH